MLNVLCGAKLFKVADQLSHALAYAMQYDRQIARNSGQNFWNNFINAGWYIPGSIFVCGWKCHRSGARKFFWFHDQENSFQTVAWPDLNRLFYRNEARRGCFDGIGISREIGEERIALELSRPPDDFSSLGIGDVQVG